MCMYMYTVIVYYTRCTLNHSFTVCSVFRWCTLHHVCRDVNLAATWPRVTFACCVCALQHHRQHRRLVQRVHADAACALQHHRQHRRLVQRVHAHGIHGQLSLKGVVTCIGTMWLSSGWRWSTWQISSEINIVCSYVWRRSGPPVTRKHIVGLESPCRAIIHYHMATVRMWVILNLNIIYCYLCGGGAGIKWPSGYARLAIP